MKGSLTRLLELWSQYCYYPLGRWPLNWNLVFFMILSAKTLLPFRKPHGSKVTSWVTFGLGLPVLVLGLGCSKPEEIFEYAVPRDVVAKAGPKTASAGPTQLLAAIIAQPDATWFVKLMGPAAQLSGHGEQFMSLLESIKFEKPDGPTFSLPPGWVRDENNPQRFATLKIPGPGEPVEVTIIKLGAQAGSDLDNINRWRGQIGLEPIGEKELATTTKQISIAGKKAVFVDITGPGGAKGGPFAMMPQRQPAPTPISSKKENSPTAPVNSSKKDQDLVVVTPPGWKEVAPKPLSLKSFQAANGTVDITITPLSGPAGGLGANINRWRGQVGLAPVDNAKAEADAKPVPSSAGKALLVDLAGTGSGAKSIIAGIVAKGSDTWFIKMMGPAEAVAKEKANLVDLLKTLIIPGQ